MQVDLPAPVAPAISMCGIFARLATTNPPSTSLPRPTTIGWWSPAATGERRTSPRLTISLSVLGISMPIADLPGIGDEDPHVGALHGVGDVLGQRGDPLDLDGGAELDLVAGDRRPAGEAGDLRVDVELLEHLGQRVRPRVVGLGARLDGRAGLAARRVRQLVGAVARGGVDSVSCSVRRGAGVGSGGAGDGRAAPAVPSSLSARLGPSSSVDDLVGARGAVETTGVSYGLWCSPARRRSCATVSRSWPRAPPRPGPSAARGASPVAQIGEPVGNPVHGRRGDHEQAEAGQQEEQRDGDPGGDGAGQRCGQQPADEAAGSSAARARPRGVRVPCAMWTRPRRPRASARASR